MAALTPADVKRWDADAIHGVFQTATNRAATLQRLGDSLQQVHNTLSDWQGDAGDAFRADLGKTRRDIDADGQESKQVAAAVSRAEADVRSVKSELDGIERAAGGYGWTITSDWRIDPGNTMIGLDRLTLAAENSFCRDSSTPANCMRTTPTRNSPPRSAAALATSRWMPSGINRAPRHRLRVAEAPGRGSAEVVAGHAVTGWSRLGGAWRWTAERPARSGRRRRRQAPVAGRHDARPG